MYNHKIEIQKTELLSDNWYVLNKITYQYHKEDQKVETQIREVYDRGNGAGILLYNTNQKTVILIRICGHRGDMMQAFDICDHLWLLAYPSSVALKIGPTIVIENRNVSSFTIANSVTIAGCRNSNPFASFSKLPRCVVLRGPRAA